MERPIDVVAWFSPRRRYPVPLSVVRDGARRRVDRVHLVHERWSAGDLQLVYALSVEGSWLKLRFDTRRVRWFLEETAPMEAG